MLERASVRRGRRPRRSRRNDRSRRPLRPPQRWRGILLCSASASHDREIALGNSERIVAVLLPAEAAGGLQRFTKLTQPDALPAAFVSLAVTRRADGDVRLVLGGVSPRPYRIYNSVEEEAMSGGLDEETIADLAERALLDAEPLSQNGYKVELAALLLRDAIRLIAEG